MSIRRVFLILSFCFVIIGILTAGALVHLTNRMTHLAELSQRQMDSVRASEELQVSLLQFSRVYFINFRRGQVVAQADRASLQKQIQELLKDVERFIDTDAERELLGKLKAGVGEYLELHSRLAALPMNDRQQPRQLPPILDQTVELAEEFTTLNSSQADDFRLAIAQENERADMIAATLGAACIFAFLLALSMISRFVVQPISNLSEEIRSLSKTNSLSKVKEAGPLEVKSIASAFNLVASQVLNQRETALRFLAGVAHDLRNPLGAIRMSSELLDDKSTSDDERSGIIQIISRQALHLDRMVGDLLDTTRIESGQLDVKKTKTNISQIVEDAVKLHRSLSNVHSINFSTVSRDLAVNADPLRITQVLNNVLSNAIKYSPNGGVIKVRLTQRNEFIVVEVSDQGIGISEEDKATVFEPFRRTKTTKATIPGVGLGLSVSKKIIEAHAGSIEIVSKVGQGTTFIILLPSLRVTQAYAPELTI